MSLILSERKYIIIIQTFGCHDDRKLLHTQSLPVPGRLFFALDPLLSERLKQANSVVELNHFVTSGTAKQTGFCWINKPHRICSWAKTAALSYSKRKVGEKNSCAMIPNFSTRSQ